MKHSNHTSLRNLSLRVLKNIFHFEAIYNRFKLCTNSEQNNSVGQACPTYEYDLNPSCHNQRPPLCYAEMFSTYNQPTIRKKSPKRSMDRSRKDFGMTQFASDFFNKNRKYFNHLSFSPIKLSAFTLAEVLIVLGIIGIIAELTIPDLISNTGKQVEYTSLLKAQTVLSQAHQLITQDSGGDFSGLVATDSSTDATGANLDFANLFKDKMKNVNFCDSTTAKNCYDVGTWKTLSGLTSAYSISGNNPTLVSADGFVYLFQIWDNNCSSDQYFRNGNKEGCGGIYVDINGIKSPNSLGKDVFVFSINKYNVTPYKYPPEGSDFYNCFKSAGDAWNGIECGAKAVAARGITYY